MVKSFYTVKELAQSTGYSRAWIAYLIRTKRIQAEQAGRDYLIPQKEAKKYLGKIRTSLNSVFPRLRSKKKTKVKLQQTKNDPLLS